MSLVAALMSVFLLTSTMSWADDSSDGPDEPASLLELAQAGEEAPDIERENLLSVLDEMEEGEPEPSALPETREPVESGTPTATVAVEDAAAAAEPDESAAEEPADKASEPQASTDATAADDDADARATGEPRHLPQCSAGFVYGVSAGGQIREVWPDGNVIDIGSVTPGQNRDMNGLGIGSGGSKVYAYHRSSGWRETTVSRATIYEYNTTTGQWSSTPHTVNSNDSGRTVQFVAGAVDLLTGDYYFGGFNSNGTLFRIWKYDPVADATSYVGAVNTAVGAGGSTNGDMAFNATGNLFIVRGSGSTTTVFSVTAANLAAASGGTIPSAGSNQVTTMNNVNGVAFDSTGKAFLGSSGILRSYDQPSWDNSTTVVSSGLNSTDLATCSSPPTITIEKYIEGGRVNATDQFTLQLHQGANELARTTTTGNSVGLQGQRIGPLPTARNVDLTFSETASGATDMSKYASSYQCHSDGVLTSSGEATSGTITVPLGTNDVVCRFHNSPLVANLSITKQVADHLGENPAPRQGWTVGTNITDGPATLNPDAPTQTTNASGNAAWEILFNSASDRANVAVWEQMQTGYQFVSASCQITSLNGNQRTITLDSADAGTLEDVAPGDQVKCDYVNKEIPGSVDWTKIDGYDDSLLGGSSWTVTGPSGFNALVEDCDAEDASQCAGPDRNPAAGGFRLEGLAWGTYTVTETTVPVGYQGAQDFTFTITADNAAADVELGAYENTRIPGEVAWTKVDAADQTLLGGSVWTLTGPGADGASVTIEDCETEPCSGPDLDPTPGAFLLEELAWGDYTLIETEAPAGYTSGSEPVEFSVGAEDVAAVIELDAVDNERILGTVVWTKVAQGSTNLLAGSEWSLTGPGHDDTLVIDCIEEADAELCTGPDMDPAAGQFTLTGLEWGDYTLTETKAPPGYQLLEESLEFSIGPDGEAVQLSWDLGAVGNDPQEGPVLPLTGGIGRDQIFLAGALLLLLSTAGYGARRLRLHRRSYVA